MNHPELTDLLDKIELELRQLRFLVGEPESFPTVTSAFGYGQVSFEQWLGRVFLPNARKAVATGELPSTSQVSTAAYRNFDGADNVDDLLNLLGAFDERINQLGRISRARG
jgi:uncharacterized protein YqcC (DUF446 family)